MVTHKMTKTEAPFIFYSALVAKGHRIGGGLSCQHDPAPPGNKSSKDKMG